LEEQYRQRTLLLGFDKKIEKGPISIYFSFEEHESEYRYSTTMPKVLWQYYIGDDQWKALETVDNTKTMTRSGTLEFFVPPDFNKKSIFNRELYWIKAVGIMEENDFQPAPKIKGIHLNTTMAVQVESIEDEILGSSDGEANQEFNLLRTPVVSEEIWVNETNTLTGEEKQAILAENGKDVVREIEDETSGTTEVLVRWQAKEDFFESSLKSRDYVIDRANGRVRFGNGLQGMIPPGGRDNIIVNYYVGGGTQGNVNAFEISDMKTSIPYVDEVSNPEPAEGGSDTEQMQGVFKRGPYMIKHRDRAVTREDFERLAAAASPYIARTKCLKAGNKLKIIVIPGEVKDKPFSSSLLLKMVEKHLISRSLNLLSPGSIDVSRPQYVEVSIEVEVVPVSIDIAVPLEAEVLKQLKAFLHPLSGGPERSGWEFGRDLQISDVYALLESIKGVDHVEKLLLNGKHQNVKVKPEETLCSGQHKITMVF
jgi:predicted phage baseplate assembly protein